MALAGWPRLARLLIVQLVGAIAGISAPAIRLATATICRLRSDSIPIHASDPATHAVLESTRIIDVHEVYRPSTCAHFAFCQPAIELIGERLAIAGAEVGWPAGDLAPAAQFVHEISDGQSPTHVGLGVQLAAGIEGLPAFGNHVGRQGNVWP